VLRDRKVLQVKLGRRVHRVHPDSLEQRGRREPLVSKGPRAKSVLKDHKDLLDLQEPLVLKEPLVFRVRLVRLGLKEIKDRLASPVLPERPDHRAPPASKDQRAMLDLKGPRVHQASPA
jgi:hypothetical protein